MKMPEPMIVPTTIAVVIHKPIICGFASVAINFPPAALGTARIAA